MKRTLVVLVVLALTACQDGLGPDAPPPDAPSLSEVSDAPVIPGRYVVRVRADQDPAEVAASHGVEPDFIYRHALKGFAAGMDVNARDGMQQDGRVVAIEPDRVVSAHDEQLNATWGLDRVDQRDLPLNMVYTFEATGAGVTVHILDTGIRYDHVEFGGRASFGFDAFGGDGSDCDGHGTHVAGTVGGTTFGVAKDVSLIAVRVLDCFGNGTVATVVAGVDWVAGHKADNPGVPMAANMSLGGGTNAMLDEAVQNMITSDVPTSLSAGNSNINACQQSPARVPEALTTGATGQNDARASFSNWGECVDLFGPGVGIEAAWFSSPTAVASISGTSMASPHVAGVMALYLENDPGASWQTVSAAVLDATTKDKVTNSNTANNDLLFSRLDLVGPPPDPEAPVADFATSCSGATCSFTDLSTGPPTSWDWDFGNGETATVPNPSTSYGSEGVFTVALTVTNDLGSDMASQTIECTETTSGRGGTSLSCEPVDDPSPPPPPPPDPDPPVASFNTSCSGATCSFTDTSDNDPTSWDWDFGNGQSSTAQNPSTSYGSEGVFTVTVTVSNEAGSDTAMQSVECTATSGPRGGTSLSCEPVDDPSPPPPPDPEPPVASFNTSCNGATCSFTDTSSGAPTSWDWDLGNGDTATTQNASTTYTSAGSFTVTLTVSNDEGSDTATDTVECTASGRGGGLSCG